MAGVQPVILMLKRESPAIAQVNAKLNFIKFEIYKLLEVEMVQQKLKMFVMATTTVTDSLVQKKEREKRLRPYVHSCFAL